MPEIHTVVNAGDGARHASFSVDLDQIPSLLAQYEEARRKLSDIESRAGELIIPPPGDDPVSAELADNLSRMAVGENQSLAYAVRDAVIRLSDQIDQLKAARDDYRTTDETATPR